MPCYRRRGMPTGLQQVSLELALQRDQVHSSRWRRDREARCGVDDHLDIEVRDTGIGIKADFLPYRL